MESKKKELATIEALVSNASDQRAEIESALQRIEGLIESQTGSNTEGETVHERQDHIGSRN